MPDVSPGEELWPDLDNIGCTDRSRMLFWALVRQLVAEGMDEPTAKRVALRPTRLAFLMSELDLAQKDAIRLLGRSPRTGKYDVARLRQAWSGASFADATKPVPRAPDDLVRVGGDE